MKKYVITFRGKTESLKYFYFRGGVEIKGEEMLELWTRLSTDEKRRYLEERAAEQLLNATYAEIVEL